MWPAVCLLTNRACQESVKLCSLGRVVGLFSYRSRHEDMRRMYSENEEMLALDGMRFAPSVS